MEVTKDITVICKHGDLELRMGKALTSFYYKGVERFVFRTSEIDDLSFMIQKAKEKYNEP